MKGFFAALGTALLLSPLFLISMAFFPDLPLGQMILHAIPVFLGLVLLFGAIFGIAVLAAYPVEYFLEKTGQSAKSIPVTIVGQKEQQGGKKPN